MGTASKLNMEKDFQMHKIRHMTYRTIVINSQSLSPNLVETLAYFEFLKICIQLKSKTYLC